MPVKDYYLLLRLEPGADTKMIKKAYRKMAMEYHPDKTGNHAVHNAHFSEIREAYEVLSSPEKREKYHYQRWLEKAMGHSIQQVHTAPELLKQFISMEQFLSGADHYRMDVIYLEKYLTTIFSKEKILIIAEETDGVLKQACISIAIKLSGMLDAKGAEHLFDIFNPVLHELPMSKTSWETLISTKRNQQKMSAWKIPLILLITILLCLIMFIMT